MFAAAVLASPDALPDAVADSKTLSPERREALAATLHEDDRIAIGVAEIPVERIDAPETDMNALTVDAQAEALAAVVEDGASSEVAGPDAGLAGIVDAGDTDAARFGRRVADAVPFEVEVRAEHGADETYPVVSAASIVAKVERDAHVAELAEEYGDIGSGYPSDPTTREFLSTYVEARGELPPVARESWQTSRDVLAAARQSSLDAFE
ncbi:MAG: ribonuclease HII [Halolamina sp.]